MIRSYRVALFALVVITAPRAGAAIRITEWMYDGVPGEFVELTNIGGPAVNMTGWSFADEATAAGAFNLSAFGVVAPGESVVFTDATEAAFRTSWNLSASVKVIGGLTVNLSRNDAIKIFDAASVQVDILDFGDQSTPGAGPRTQNAGGNPLTIAALGVNNPALWKLAIAGDVYGSVNNATANSVGNPGKFLLTPEPGGLTLAVLGLASLALRRRSAR